MKALLVALAVFTIFDHVVWQGMFRTLAVGKLVAATISVTGLDPTAFTI